MNGGAFLNLTGDLAYKALLPTHKTGISPAIEINLPETPREEASWS
jgi:hypothetical protein